MPKFPPFTAYLLSEMEVLIDRHDLVGPFLDGGCGPGYVAARLASRGWSGVAIDNSPTALAQAREHLATAPGVRLVAGDIEALGKETFPTAVLFDVLEHVPDDEGLLRKLASLQPPGGMLILTVPTNAQREWRWDDDLWGHLRRYSQEEMDDLLRRVGYQPVEMWDVSLPFFWLLRRCYTAMRKSPPISGTPRERTIEAHLINPWDFGPLYSLVSNVRWWKPLFALQRLWRSQVERGHEMIVLARLVTGDW